MVRLSGRRLGGNIDRDFRGESPGWEMSPVPRVSNADPVTRLKKQCRNQVVSFDNSAKTAVESFRDGMPFRGRSRFDPPCGAPSPKSGVQGNQRVNSPDWTDHSAKGGHLAVDTMNSETQPVPTSRRGSFATNSSPHHAC